MVTFNACEGNKSLEKKLKSKIISALRRLWCFSSDRTKAKRKNKMVGFALYICDGCQKGSKKVSVDHILPVVPVYGWDDWDGFITRLFCGTEGLQILCKGCHKKKTDKENEQRRQLEAINDTHKGESSHAFQMVHHPFPKAFA